MKTFAVVVLLLTSMLMAETQEAAYFRALKAEEAGDVSLALESFEQALALPGPYTDEIREIVQEYYDALDMTADTSKVPWSFRFLGKLDFYGLRYSEFGGVDEVDEHGGNLLLSLTPYFDYSAGDWIHSVGLRVDADWFFANDDMPVLDTNDWDLSLGLEYSLVGRSLMVSVGTDLEFSEGEKASPSFFGWVEKDLFRYDRHRFGLATWAFYDADGPLSFALYGAWHRNASYGWNAGVYLGARFEADTVVDYVQYVADYMDALEERQGNPPSDFKGNGWAYGRESKNPFDQCLETYGEECYEWGIAKVDSLYWAEQENSAGSDSVLAIQVPRYYAKWLGPTLRSKVSYRFKTNIMLEAKLNLFYGLVLDGPDADYEKIGKFSGSWGALFYWKPDPICLYLGFDQFYKHYSLPDYYVGVYPKNTLLSEIVAGIKWEI